jgi:hypothetical protein
MRYLDHATSSINNPPTREKFAVLSIVWFVLQEPFTSLQRGIKLARWDGLCATLFGFDSEGIKWDWNHYKFMRDPTKYNDSPIKADLWDRTPNIPEPILSYRLAHVAISCMRYCKPGEAHNIDDLRIFPYLLCLVIFLSYIPVVSVMFSLSLHSPHRHLVSSSLVHLRIIRWSCQFPGPTTSEAAVRRQPSTFFLTSTFFASVLSQPSLRWLPLTFVSLALLPAPTISLFLDHSSNSAAVVARLDLGLPQP